MHTTSNLLKTIGFFSATLLLNPALGCNGSLKDENSASVPSYPTLLSPQISACISDPLCTRPMVVSHRGEGGNDPENSIAAIKNVAGLGAHIVEIDLRMSKDGIPILMHDDTLERTTDQEERFPEKTQPQDLTMDELQELVLYDPQGVCETNSLNDSDHTERCRIPTLQDAILAAKDRAILMLDYKNGNLETIAQVLNDTDAHAHVFFFDADTDNLDTMEALVPGLITMARANDATSTNQLIDARSPVLLHIDPGYLDEAHLAAQTSQTKLLLNVFLVSDLYLIGDELADGNEENRDLAAASLHDLLYRGAQLIQTNRPKETRELCDEWVNLNAASN